MADWLQAEINRLGAASNVEEKMETLARMKIKLGNLSNDQVRQISRSLDFNGLFSLLTVDDRDYTERMCDILKTLFTACETGEVLQRYPAEILRLVAHENSSIKSLVLSELFRTVKDPQMLSNVVTNFPLLVAIVDRIADDDLMVAEFAISIIKKIGEHPESLKVIYSEELLKIFNVLLVKNDIVSFRIYEVIVNLAKTSKDGLDAGIQSGLMNRLLGILDNEDILLQLNALEVITEMALTDDGLRYLEQQEVLRKLVQKIEQAHVNALSNLLIPGLMKFFGNVARLWPNEFFSNYPTVVTALFEVIDNGDQTILGVALDTLGHVGSTVEGKYALQALGDCMPMTMRKIGEIVQLMPTALRLRGLNNMALLLEVKKTEQDNKILSLTKKWFDFVSEDPMSTLVSLCRQPFADIRQASLEVLAVIAAQTWGQEYVSIHPGLTEFLLDRNIESFKECKEVKFEVVQQLLQAERSIFDTTTMQRFREFVDQGPFYVDTYTEVAMESAT